MLIYTEREGNNGQIIIKGVPERTEGSCAGIFEKGQYQCQCGG